MSQLLPFDAVDFGIFVRGCAMITQRIQDEGWRTIFNNLSRKSTTYGGQSAASTRLSMATYPQGSQLQVLLSKGIVSLCAAQKFVGNRYRGMRFLINLQSIFSGLQVSPNRGYNRFVDYYAIWFKVAQDREVFSGHSADAESQLLWVFCIALQLFTTLLVDDACSCKTHRQCPERLNNSMATRKMAGLMEWLYAIEALAPTHLQKHFTWPRLVSDEAMSQFDIPFLSEAGVQAKIAALSNFPSRSHFVFGHILELSASLANWTEDLLASGGGENRFGTEEYWQSISPKTIVRVLEQDR
ncbi:hypothetical protein PV04_06638 [Phialophora macrospora]|uniref:Uncharacterized protein n=1 Tax=Phialophora macrospora TaxID=1851006 RepID=A0A0D2DZ27_9EURO|nr:hypothetical protein PV04_06638 [Phialophora macrospora]